MNMDRWTGGRTDGGTGQRDEQSLEEEQKRRSDAPQKHRNVVASDVEVNEGLFSRKSDIMQSKSNPQQLTPSAYGRISRNSTGLLET